MVRPRVRVTRAPFLLWGARIFCGGEVPVPRASRHADSLRLSLNFGVGRARPVFAFDAPSMCVTSSVSPSAAEPQDIPDEADPGACRRPTDDGGLGRARAGRAAGSAVAPRFAEPLRRPPCAALRGAEQRRRRPSGDRLSREARGRTGERKEDVSERRAHPSFPRRRSR